MNSKERFLACIKGEKVDKIPVFPLLMSFAAKRHGLTYEQFAGNGLLLAEAQQKIFEDFSVDAVTACSDAFRISADLGGKVIFSEDKPPYIERPIITSEDDLKRLSKPDISDKKSRTYDRVSGVSQLSRTIGNECAVLGWVDMPFAEACSACGVSEFMLMLYDEPELAHKILDFLTDIVIDFAVAQVEAGAVMIGAGDAAASLISPELFSEFALPYEKKVCDAIHKKNGLVKLHICGNTTRLLELLVQNGADLYNVDHMVSIKLANEKYMGADKAFKGNIDPVGDMLYATPEQCASRVKDCIKNVTSKKYMLSAGCEVPADVSDEVFRAFCRKIERG